MSDLLDLSDGIDRQHDIIRFIAETLAHHPPDIQLSTDGIQGLYCILTAVEDELDSISGKLMLKHNKKEADHV
jgi:hypothetical protein